MMKIDPLCEKCQKECKQQFPAIVVFCAKFSPALRRKQKNVHINRIQRGDNAKRSCAEV